MKIADIVKNSIWYDPRVRKQLAEYTRRPENVVAVGITDVRYNREAVEILPCRAVLVPYNNTAGQNFFVKFYVKFHPTNLYIKQLSGKSRT